MLLIVGHALLSTKIPIPTCRLETISDLPRPFGTIRLTLPISLRQSTYRKPKEMSFVNFHMPLLMLALLCPGGEEHSPCCDPSLYFLLSVVHDSLSLPLGGRESSKSIMSEVAWGKGGKGERGKGSYIVTLCSTWNLSSVVDHYWPINSSRMLSKPQRHSPQTCMPAVVR